VELFNEFSEFISNKELEIPMIYEDCKACIDLVKGAKGQIRTKQIVEQNLLHKEISR
jgi:hypothetical protein